MITLSQQRDLQLQELNLLNKEIMIMEQKNLKLEHALEVLYKEDSNMERILNLLQQRMVQMNTQLVIQKGLKEELEDKNSITKTEGIQSLEDAELNLIKLQSDLKQLFEEKALLKDNLDAVQQESLSWEKKVIIFRIFKNINFSNIKFILKFQISNIKFILSLENINFSNIIYFRY